MRRFTFHILIAVLTFGVGSFIVSNFLINKDKRVVIEHTQEIIQEKVQKTEYAMTNSKIETNKSNCDEWSDEVDYQPIIKKWLNGEKLKNVPYCSKNAKEAESYNSSNVTPMLIDLNKDGKEELALKSNCSPTGNCNMEIFEKKGKSYRKFFTDVHGVQVFELSDFSNKGFYDISAKMHSSANSDDLVIYRFNGNVYKPSKCFNYIYEEIKSEYDEVKFKDEPTITPTKCWEE